MTKQELRAAIRHLKKSFTFEQLEAKSEVVCHKLLALPELQNTTNVLVYWALKDEVQTQSLVQELSKQTKVFLPVVNGKDLDVLPFAGLEQMKEVPPYGILEPQGTPITDLSVIDLAIIPGMAFDCNGNRLGRGKAFYDGLLPKLNCLKVGLCFDFQLLESIPVESHDIAMDMVVSE